MREGEAEPQRKAARRLLTSDCRQAGPIGGRPLAARRRGSPTTATGEPKRLGLLSVHAALGALVVVSVFSCTKETTGSSSGQAPATTSAPLGTTPTPAGGSAPGSSAQSTPAKYAGFDDPLYAKGENWLCGPGIATDDRCLRADLDVTVVKADGTTELRRSTTASDAGFDCFYVYPTVNFTGGPNDETMAADTAVEDAVTRAQAARFREVCRVYAPLYRQLTLGGFGASGREQAQAMAYGDVRNAFRQYMANWNGGRPVLLIGHSQGSGLLDRLMRDEFDGDSEMRGKLVSAMLIGGFSSVATGQDAGGSFENIPKCSKPDQTRCVIGFNTVAIDTPESDLQRWGGTEPGKQRLCTAPASLGGGPGRVTPIVATQGTEHPTPWVEYPQALIAKCRANNNLVTMLITAAPGDPRDLGDRIRNVPGWGLHINELNLTHGDLISIARQQGTSAIGGR